MKPVVRVQRLQRRSTLNECEARDFFSSSSINPAIFSELPGSNLAFEGTSIFYFSLQYLAVMEISISTCVAVALHNFKIV